MTSRVGTKGQVVIEKGIRDALGIVPGSVAVQRLVGETVELRFLPPEHSQSLLGALASYVKVATSTEDLRIAEDESWSAAAVQEDRETIDGDR